MAYVFDHRRKQQFGMNVDQNDGDVLGFCGKQRYFGGGERLGTGLCTARKSSSINSLVAHVLNSRSNESLLIAAIHRHIYDSLLTGVAVRMLSRSIVIYWRYYASFG